MNKEENVIKYYMLCNTLKDVIRTGWKKWNVERERIESVAEHVFGVQQLAIAIFYEYKYNLDLKKVIMMLAVHELEEVGIGDLTQFDISEEEKQDIGHKVVHKILSEVIEAPDIENLIFEFDERKTEEALFAHLCDKLEGDIQCKIYDEENTVNIKEQLSNPIFEDEYVKTVTENKENRTWSDLWLSVTKEKYVYDINFQNLWKYIYKNDIKDKNKK